MPGTGRYESRYDLAVTQNLNFGSHSTRSRYVDEFFLNSVEDTFRMDELYICTYLYNYTVMGKTHRKLDTHTHRNRARALQMKEAMGWLEARKSRIHGRGVFARRDIPAGTRLIEYVGLPISKKKSDELTAKQNRYLFTLNGTSDLDGKVSWNPARLINHSCEPNCVADQDGEDRIWIFSTRPIASGEEVTFNYGYSLEDFRNFPCRCGAASCTGYMVSEELLPVVRSLLAQSS